MVRRSFIGALLGFLGLGVTTQAAEAPPKKTEGITGRELLAMPEFIALAEYLGINLTLPISSLTIDVPHDGLVTFTIIYRMDPANVVREGLPKESYSVDGHSFYRDPVFVEFMKKVGFDYFAYTKDFEILILSMDFPALFRQKVNARQGCPLMLDTTTQHNDFYRTKIPNPAVQNTGGLSAHSGN